MDVLELVADVALVLVGGILTIGAAVVTGQVELECVNDFETTQAGI